MSQLSARDLVIICHLLGFVGVLVPLGHVLAPLAFWMWKRGENPVLEIVGRDVINFQITMTLCFLMAVFLLLVLIETDFVLFIVSGYAALFVFYVFCMAKAAFLTYRHMPYFYPFTIRFLK